MTSTKRIEANLRNSRQSTGPRTLSGKARARLNAVTHGLTAETLILPGEDPLEFQRRLAKWTAQLAPVDPFEEDLVRQVVTLSWRLDRADRVQDALIADSIARLPDEDKLRREEVADLGRRLLPPPRGPALARRFDIAADLDRLALSRPDDPGDPPRLLLRLEATADGCRWLLDRWAELRPIIDAGTAWPPERMVQAIRLLGRTPLDAADDRRVLALILACCALDGSRPDPLAELRETATRPEATCYRQRLLGRRLDEAMPRSQEEAREVLLVIVDETVSRLEEQERHNRERETARAALRPVKLLFDASPEGEWVRREQGKATRAILRIVGRFLKARRRGETLSPEPPRPPRLDPTPAEPMVIGPLNVPQGRMDDPYQWPGHEGRFAPVSIFDQPEERLPKESIGGRAAGHAEAVAALKKRKPGRYNPARAGRIANRLIDLTAKLGPVLLIAASLWATAAAPVSGRPEDSAGRSQPILLDDAPDQPGPGHPGPAWSFLSVDRGSNPRNGQNEPKDGEVVRVLPARPTRVIRLTDRSRGPPRARGDPSSAARPGCETPDGRAVADSRALDGDAPSGQGGRIDVTTAGFRPGPVANLATSGCERGS